jgi:hypothetical protein
MVTASAVSSHHSLLVRSLEIEASRRLSDETTISRIELVCPSREPPSRPVVTSLTLEQQSGRGDASGCWRREDQLVKGL